MLMVMLLILAGMVAGAINAVAGGGAILLFPILLALDVPPVEATATLFLAVLPGFLGALSGYRQEISHAPASLKILVIPVMAGALLGAISLTHIDPAVFSRYIPWLVLSAVLLLVFQTHIHHLIVTERHLVKTNKRIGPIFLALSLFILSIYGGFFGVGVGIMMIAALGLSSRVKNAQQLSALKIWYVCGIDLVAFTIFINNGMINFYYGSIMAVGTVFGGYLFARYSRRISSHMVHNLMVGVSGLIVLYLFIK